MLLLLCVIHYRIFFFKQKTAYELRISDWSSDVCSSDLIHAVHVKPSHNAHRRWKHARRSAIDQPVHHQIPIMRRQPHAHPIAPVQPPAERQPQQPPLQRLHSTASLISISGTDCPSPAANVVRINTSRSSAKPTSNP